MCLGLIVTVATYSTNAKTSPKLMAKRRAEIKAAQELERPKLLQQFNCDPNMVKDDDVRRERMRFKYTLTSDDCK